MFIGTIPPAAAATPCEGLGLTGPLVLDFERVLRDCRAGACPLRFTLDDARFDALLFGPTQITAASMGRFAGTEWFPPYIGRARDALRKRSYREAFAAYRAELSAPLSLTRQREFAEGRELRALSDVLDRGAAGPLDAAHEAALADLCAAHPQSKQLRFYAAADRMEHHDPLAAIRLLLSVPYRHPVEPEAHYEALDNAALREALDISPKAAALAMRAMQARLRHHLRERRGSAQ